MSGARPGEEPVGTMCGPVFVVGAPRSGTTLVYSILLASGEFPLYRAESRIVECSTRYGPLRRDANFRRFLRDYRSSRQFARSGLTIRDLEAAPPDSRSSYAAFLGYFMGLIAQRQGRGRWAEKTPNHLFHMSELEAEFPAARFIHVVRDGRDVALSQRRLRMDRSPSRDPVIRLLWAGRIWERIARAGRRSGARLGKRYLEIRYEDVIEDLDGALARLADFTGLELSRAAVEASEVAALGEANTAFGVGMGGVSARALQRWRSALSPEEIDVLHWSIGRTLRAFGYEAEAGSPGRGPVALRRKIHHHLSASAIGGKRFLNRHTPLGRLARKPLEIGLT
ncbi:MAG: sulfotransferase [Gemmatimonadota bacterium]